MMSTMPKTELDFSKKTVIFLDEEYFTTVGVLEVMGVGKTTLSKEIKDGKIEVFDHPHGHLFHPAAVTKWKEKRTKRLRR